MNRISALVFAVALGMLAGAATGCSALSSLNPISSQHPAWAMNPADCAVLGTVVAPMLGLVPMASAASIFGAVAGSSFCKAESSLVAGQPAQVTTTTVVQSGTTKATQ